MSRTEVAVGGRGMGRGARGVGVGRRQRCTVADKCHDNIIQQTQQQQLS